MGNLSMVAQCQSLSHFLFVSSMIIMHIEFDQLSADSPKMSFLIHHIAIIFLMLLIYYK